MQGVPNWKVEDHFCGCSKNADQVLIAGDRDDSSYMFRKLHEQYSKWGLRINTKKTEYMVVGDDEREDLDVGIGTIKNVCTFKYLGVTFTTNGKSTQDIANKVGQGKRVIGQLNSLLWSDKISQKTKILLYKAIVESITTYGAETWELNKVEKNKLPSLEMDFWRRSRISRLLQRMDDNRWPKRIHSWTPSERRKRGRPPRRWKQGVVDAMNSRGLQEEDWTDRSVEVEKGETTNVVKSAIYIVRTQELRQRTPLHVDNG
ncbi:uncharacterized protein LOC115879632 [Sitophilus oryzae]|uniref:Uncharacterized protein LOC115879632 n=1 Tax=Sitophilus oryzae TaxID=7048 RepID=A0A6J2XMU8_SITOR|nr:uncharacterized protein LOC115879632 [Sitophilus oryzae]